MLFIGVADNNVSHTVRRFMRSGWRIAWGRHSNAPPSEATPCRHHVKSCAVRRWANCLSGIQILSAAQLHGLPKIDIDGATGHCQAEVRGSEVVVRDAFILKPVVLHANSFGKSMQLIDFEADALPGKHEQTIMRGRDVAEFFETSELSRRS